MAYKKIELTQRFPGRLQLVFIFHTVLNTAGYRNVISGLLYFKSNTCILVALTIVKHCNHLIKMALRFVLGLVILSHFTVAQDVSELDKRNGFKDIKLASNVSAYEGLEYKKDIEDETFPNAKLYTAKKGHYESIGNLKIYDLEVKVYNDSIFEIRVITEKDPNLYKGLKKAFGEPQFGYRTGYYYWSSDRLRLSYGSYSNNKIEMIYNSFVMNKKRKEEKKQVVEEIVDDF